MDPHILYRIHFTVKRPAKAICGALLLLLAPAPPPVAWGQADPLPWLNGVRRDAGMPSLAADDLLCSAARQWSAALARAGLLGHRGSDGSTALDRYRSLGGTEARVGEILGAGPKLSGIEEGWMRSAEHRSLALAPQWTHVGWGSDRAGATQVWVVLFCQKLVEGLRIERGTGSLVISGTLRPVEAAQPVLLSGLHRVPARSWDEGSRRFRFVVAGLVPGDYLRLGYLSPDGAFRLTNAFTLLPGTESPGETSRSSAPAPSP